LLLNIEYWVKKMTKYNDNQVLWDIESRLDIVDIVSETVKLSRKGGRYWGLCPFHQEKTPSFCVTPEKNMFYCFGCHTGGNMFNFVMKRDGLDFKEAVNVLANRAGIKLANNQGFKQPDNYRHIISINRIAAEYFHQTLWKSSGSSAMKYLVNREITQETMKLFQLGYAPDSWNSLTDYLLARGFFSEHLQLSGLIKRSDKSKSYFDIFRNRIIFPIFKYNGEIVGFGGRVLDDSIPKYLNSPETKIFSKRLNLYGLYQAKEQIRKLNEAILVEGYMDCIKLHQAGINNVVAALGTALTTEQAGLLRRYTENVLVLYDGDEAGQREALRAVHVLAKENLNVSVVVLPEKKDPDEYLQKYGKEEFWQYIKNNKTSYIEFKINRHMSEEKDITIAVKARIIKAVKDDINRLGNELEKDFYIKMLAQKLMIEENLIKKELFAGHNLPKSITNRNKNTIVRDNIKYGNYNIEEQIMVAMLQRAECFKKIKENIGLEFFTRPELQVMVKIYNELDGPENQKLNKLIHMANEKGLGSLMARIMLLIEDNKSSSDMEIDSFIRRVKMSRRKSQWQEVLQKLNKLHSDGNFMNLLGFILQLDHFINNTREGGKR